MGYKKELILNFNKLTIGFHERNEKGYSSYNVKDFENITDMIEYVSRYLHLSQWRVFEIIREY